MSLDDLRKFALVDPPVLDAKMRFIFFTHNKVAQTSVNRHLLKYRSIVKKDSASVWRVAFNRYCKLWSCGQPFTFTIVRNPYFRTFSAFNYLQRIRKIDQSAEFNHFISDVLSKTKTSFDPHFMPQEKYHKPIHDMGLDRIIYFESLAEGWKDMAPYIDASTVLPHKNSSPIKQPLRTSFSEKTIEIIEELYADDFDRLGYDRWSRSSDTPQAVANPTQAALS